MLEHLIAGGLGKWLSNKTRTAGDVLINAIEDILANEKGNNTYLKKLTEIFKKNPTAWAEELTSFSKKYSFQLWHENDKLKGVVQLGIKISNTAKGASEAINGYKILRLPVGRLTMMAVRGVGTILRVAGPQILVTVVATWAVTTATEWLTRQLRNRQACIVSPLTHKGKPLVAGINGHQGLLYGEDPSDDGFMSDKWITDKLSFLEWVGVTVPDYKTGEDSNG